MYRLIPAYHFKSRSAGDGIIQDHVNELLHLIEDDMKQAIENDNTCAKTEIPAFFDIPGMDKKRARTHVYFHILRALRQANYIPSIEISKTNTGTPIVHIGITWLSKEDNDLEDQMDRFIEAHRVKKLIRNTAPGAPPTRRRKWK
jgi:hypothetical protein